MRSTRVHAILCLGVVAAFLSPCLVLVAKTRLVRVNPQLKDSAPKRFFSSEATSTRDGVYSAAQAERGKVLYGTRCAVCHGPTLEGTGTIAPLAGDDFMAKWSGKTLADLYNTTQTTMPTSQPGSLSAEETTQLLAYILKANRFPGGKELPKDATSLSAIHIERAQLKH